MSKKLSLEEKIAKQKAKLNELEKQKIENTSSPKENVKIKIGDKVMAVNIIGIYSGLTKNKIYTVTGVHEKSGDITVTADDGKNLTFFSYRFKLASKEEMKSSPKLEEKKAITVKPGDYVVCNDKGDGDGFVFNNVYLCDNRTIPNYVRVEKDSNGVQNGWASQFFRFATNDEIYQYLLKQANDRGIKIGAIVKDKEALNYKFDVQSFVLIVKREINIQSITVSNYFDKVQRPFLAANGIGCQLPVDCVEIYDEQKELFDRLVKEANSKGIKIGAIVKWLNNNHRIEELILINKDNYSKFSCTTQSYWIDKKIPFLSARFSCFNIPIDDVKLYDEKKEAAKIRADLEAKMIKEANDKGFIVGAKIVRSDKFEGVIDSLFLVDETNYKNYSWAIQDGWQKNNIAFLGVKYKDRTTPLFEFTLKPDDEIKEVKARLDKLEKEKKELEEKSKFKPGDYVTVIDSSNVNTELSTGKTYEFECYEADMVRIKRNDYGNHGSYFCCRFRLSTNDEIYNYLVEKARLDGFVVGAKIIWNKAFQNANVEKIRLYTGNEKNESWVSKALENYYDKVRVPFLALCCCGLTYPLNECELYKDDIIIKVDNVDYKAVFKPGYVEFGCARISNQVILDAYKLFNVSKYNGNRKIEAVQIGKGLFNMEILSKMIMKLLD